MCGEKLTSDHRTSEYQFYFKNTSYCLYKIIKTTVNAVRTSIIKKTNIEGGQKTKTKTKTTPNFGSHFDVLPEKSYNLFLKQLRRIYFP